MERADGGGMAINLRFKNGQARFEGREAERIAAIVIPKVNRFGGSREQINGAVREIESVGSPDAYLDTLTKVSKVYTKATVRLPDQGDFPGWRGFRRRGRDQWSFKEGLFGLPPEHRLALEMSLHEEAERRAMEGELGELERAWKDAEEIAAISDNLLVEPGVDRALQAIKKKV